MELTAEEPRVVFEFHDLDQFTIRRYSADHESCRLQDFTIGIVKLIAVAMALEDNRPSRRPRMPGSPALYCRVGAQSHAAALVTRYIAFLHGLAAEIIPLFEQVNNRLACSLIGIPTVRFPDTGKITCNFYHGTLHSKTNAEVGYAPLSRIFYRFYLTSTPRITKSSGTRMPSIPLSTS